MTHWLDDAATGLAQGRLTRRSLLLKGGSAAAAVAFGRLASPVRALGAIQRPARRTPTGCVITHDRRTQVTKLVATLKFKGKPLTLHTQITQDLHRAGATRVSYNISLGKTTVLNVDLTRSKHGLRQISTGSVTFGLGVSGVREATFTSTDGKTLHGKVDGRAFRGFRIHSDLSKLRFTDGKPPPKMRTDPALDQALTKLFALAAQESRRKKCVSATGPVAHPASNAGRSDDPNSSQSCIDCVATCVSAGVSCAAGFAAGCVPTACAYPACLAAGIAGCLLIQGGCTAGCHFGGAPCCPVSCGSVACCYGDDTCLDPNRGVCCPTNTSPCHNQACCDTTEVCLTDGTCCLQDKVSTEGICCPQSNVSPPVSCHHICCATDEVCKDGVTCCPPNDPICNGVCCRGGACDSAGACCFPPGHICGGVCCPGFNACCAGVCCALNDQCIGGACCPQSQVCGSVCCPTGQSCTNPGTGQCAPCPSGQTSTSCENASGPNTSTCCPPSDICCAGQCCPPSDTHGNIICCTPIHPDFPPYNNFQFGCHHEAACIA